MYHDSKIQIAKTVKIIIAHLFSLPLLGEKHESLMYHQTPVHVIFGYTSHMHLKNIVGHDWHGRGLKLPAMQKHHDWNIEIIG